ncbi:MAG: phosphotransferase [Caldilineaceae bacterium]
MQDQTTQLPWEAPTWLDQTSAWINAQVAACGWQSLSPVEIVRLRPWSAFARVATTNGIVYFKATAPDCHYEAALTQALARWRPYCTVPLLAVDLDCGWLLSADAGPTLHAASPSTDQFEHWLKVLPLCVELQLAMVDHLPELLTFGLFDRRLTHLPHLYNQLMAGHENLRVGLEPGLTPEEYQRLQALQPWVTDACAQLAELGLPETLVHEEVHSTNVLVNGDRYIFTDWSEAAITHPFFMMVVTLRGAAIEFGLDESGPVLRRLRDAYLEPWTAFATLEQLSNAFALANRLAMVNRALSWHHGTGSLDQRHKAPMPIAYPIGCATSWRRR